MKKTILCLLMAAVCMQAAFAQYKTITGIPYRDGSAADEYQRERCRLDLYYPENSNGFATVVWFHGGGLVGGEKFIPEQLTDKGFAIAAANYRLSPHAHAPAYFDDAAAAVAWVFDNIGSYGGDVSKIYVAGHSAGGYLTSVIALSKDYLSAYGVDSDDIKAWMPISGQSVTHWQICRERGDSAYILRVDAYAPLSHVRKGTPRIVLTAGQTDMEMDNRTVENRYLYEALRTVGNDNVSFYEINGFNHGNVVIPSLQLLVEMIEADEKGK
ncbi:MAG: alpha/beta hydrolase [Alistipes sp.]|nr:alpha/beta hydrolase [Alistipes sp.]